MYVSALLSGTVDPFWPHAVFISASVIASIAVGAGILLERPQYSPLVHRTAMWLVVSGVVIESICTVCLFVFDEGISGVQQAKIIALETRLAPRKLTNESLVRIVAVLSQFSNIPFDVAVDENAEPRRLLGQILGALYSAHWDRKSWGGPGGMAIYLEGKAIALMPLDGVTVAYDASQEKDFGPPAKALASALSNEGIPTAVTTDAITRAEQIRLMVGVKP